MVLSTNTACGDQWPWGLLLCWSHFWSKMTWLTFSLAAPRRQLPSIRLLLVPLGTPYIVDIWTTWGWTTQMHLYSQFFSVVNTTVPQFVVGSIDVQLATDRLKARWQQAEGVWSKITEKKKGVKKKLAQIIWDIKLYFLLLKRYSEATRIDFFFW